MIDKHPVVDSDARWIINPESREITTTSNKLELIQGDHQSERITFEIPKIVEGHDMSLCDRIEVHYINIDRKTKTTSKDVYITDDAVIDENNVVFSWLISGNATKYYGSLNFVICFECLDADGNYTYKWNTEICKLLIIGEGISNTTAVTEDYSDILEKFRKEVIGEATKETVKFAEQTLTDAEKVQARKNIDAISSDDLVQSDMMEWDETSKSYVKNRLGYIDVISDAIGSVFPNDLFGMSVTMPEFTDDDKIFAVKVYSNDGTLKRFIEKGSYYCDQSNFETTGFYLCTYSTIDKSWNIRAKSDVKEVIFYKTTYVTIPSDYLPIAGSDKPGVIKTNGEISQSDDFIYASNRCYFGGDVRKNPGNSDLYAPVNFKVVDILSKDDMYCAFAHNIANELEVVVTTSMYGADKLGLSANDYPIRLYRTKAVGSDRWPPSPIIRITKSNGDYADVAWYYAGGASFSPSNPTWTKVGGISKFLVTVTQTDETYSADHTFEEIYAAYQNGSYIECTCNGQLYHVYSINSSNAAFIFTDYAPFSGSNLGYNMLCIDSNNSVTMTSVNNELVYPPEDVQEGAVWSYDDPFNGPVWKLPVGGYDSFDNVKPYSQITLSNFEKSSDTLYFVSFTPIKAVVLGKSYMTFINDFTGQIKKWQLVAKQSDDGIIIGEWNNNAPDFTNYPFCILVKSDGTNLIYRPTNDEIYIGIFELTPVKFPEKYLPPIPKDYFASTDALPQHAMAADPTEDMQIVTKKYADRLVANCMYLQSPNGTKYKLSVSDDGVLSAVQAE